MIASLFVDVDWLMLLVFVEFIPANPSVHALCRSSYIYIGMDAVPNALTDIIRWCSKLDCPCL